MNNWNTTGVLDDPRSVWNFKLHYVPDSTSAFQAVRNGISRASLAMM